MNAKCQETRSSESLLSAPSRPRLAQALPLFSSKAAFKPHLLLRSKDARPGGRRLDSSYRSAFDRLCDLEQVTALLWGFFSPFSTVAVNALGPSLKLQGPGQPADRAGAQGRFGL